MSSVSSYFNRNKPQQTPYMPSDTEISNALKPLFVYFDDNFAIMNQTLTSEAMMMVMTRLLDSACLSVVASLKSKR